MSLSGRSTESLSVFRHGESDRVKLHHRSPARSCSLQGATKAARGAHLPASQRFCAQPPKQERGNGQVPLPSGRAMLAGFRYLFRAFSGGRPASENRRVWSSAPGNRFGASECLSSLFVVNRRRASLGIDAVCDCLGSHTVGTGGILGSTADAA